MGETRTESATPPATPAQAAPAGRTAKPRAPRRPRRKRPKARPFLGWGITLALAALALVLMAWADASDKRRIAAVAEQARAPLWWGEADVSWTPLMILVFLIVMVLPDLFGGARWNWRKPLVWPVSRRVVAAASLGAVLVVAGATAWIGRPQGGLGFPESVVWVDGDRMIERRPWSAAALVETSCELLDGSDRTKAPAASYVVTFPDGRWASLLDAQPESYERLERILPIDAALRAAGVPRRAALTHDCLARGGPDLGVTGESLARLLAP
ncbi:hypothetical protein [Caulobacter mirabilis]|uniref:Uncharacterized protein n=1 Tax=Caulobacter mirabilis TaxID=69666 RepID=A0A2D2AU07_9CAUL|nr:hypothetical protein [Caulobacter mirabilis]ATQ41494.1 hypothetical protein CSW64_03230 [Caulobacter mirabilis]